MTVRLVTVRDNGQASLKKYLEPGPYQLTQNDDGSVLLSPVDLVPRKAKAEPEPKAAPKANAKTAK